MFIYKCEFCNCRIWSYRKAAWAIEDLEQDIGLVYRAMGMKGLQGIPAIGKKLGQENEAWLKAELKQAD